MLYRMPIIYAGNFHNGKEDGWKNLASTSLAAWDRRADLADKQESYSSLIILGFSFLRPCVCSVERS